MRIVLNGEPREVARPRLAEALDELGFGGATVATARQRQLRAGAGRAPRPSSPRATGVEVLAPRQGG